MDDLKDKQVVRKCLQGDRNAFSELVEKYQVLLYQLIFGMVHNKDDADELTQAVFVKVYEKLDQFNSKYKFFSWIYRITVNETLNYIKKKKPQDALEAVHISTGEQPDDFFADDQRQILIRGALDELSPDYRIVMILKHFQEFSYREISEVLGIPEKTVKSRLFSARQNFREILTKKGLVF